MQRATQQQHYVFDSVEFLVQAEAWVLQRPLWAVGTQRRILQSACDHYINPRSRFLVLHTRKEVPFSLFNSVAL